MTHATWPEVMRIRTVAILALGGFALAACAPATKPPATAKNGYHISGQAFDLARNSALNADASPDKQEKARLAKEGMAAADDCVMKNPEEAGCYYYRALNTGAYYEAHVIGYQDGLKSMIRDCEKVIALDDKFDHGGGYRTIGKILTDVPETTISKNGVTRDLDKAIEYLEKAVQIDGAYPENQLYLADALFEAGQMKEAIAVLSNATQLVPQWKNHRDYSMWQKMSKNLSKKIK